MSSDRDRWLQRVRATWNERAPFWDEMSEANAATADRQADIDRLMTALNLAQGSLLLDAGCGSGQFAIALAQRGCSVTGIDIAPAMIERARQHAQKAAVAVEWRLGDLAHLMDPDARYDAIYARTIIQFSPDVPSTLQEFRRVLKPGGRLFISVPGSLSPIYAESWRRHLEPHAHAVNYMVPWELEALLTDAGWSILDQWGDASESLSGRANPGTQLLAPEVNLRVRQAVSTTWAFIAT